MGAEGTNISVDVKLKCYCEICGGDLEIKDGNHINSISVEPCATCLDKSYADGKEGK